jgi:type IV secretory pathway VirB10-like protein
MPTWYKTKLIGIALAGLFTASSSLGAGLDTLSKNKPESPSTPQKAKANSATETTPSTATPAVTPKVLPPTKPTVATPPAPAVKPVPANKKRIETKDEVEDAADAATQEKPEASPEVVRSQMSKAMDNRLSLSTSLGWAVIKPSKGAWIGVGASDLSARWRESQKGDGKLFITMRYAPFTGVWSVSDRDYDTTLHGIYGGAEFHKTLEAMGAATLKAGVELGYMLVYADPQDKAEAAGDVKSGKVNLTTGGGLEWGILKDKVKVGPFARLHLAGFTIFNVGGSINFVF